MLTITIPSSELYDEKTSAFSVSKEQTIVLEHSLVSLSKWESKWKKPFITKGEKTTEESIDYIRCMCITQNVDDSVFLSLTRQNIEDVRRYIEDPMTATTFNNKEQSKINREIITSEVIYFWMITFNIPFECQKWHLNRLLTLINVCNLKNAPQKKMSQKDLLSRNRALNEMRKAQLHTGG